MLTTAKYEWKHTTFTARLNVFLKSFKLFFIDVDPMNVAWVAIKLKLSGGSKEGKLDKFLNASSYATVAKVVSIVADGLVDKWRENVGGKLSGCRAFGTQAPQVTAIWNIASTPTPSFRALLSRLCRFNGTAWGTFLYGIRIFRKVGKFACLFPVKGHVPRVPATHVFEPFK